MDKERRQGVVEALVCLLNYKGLRSDEGDDVDTVRQDSDEAVALTQVQCRRRKELAKVHSVHKDDVKDHQEERKGKIVAKGKREDLRRNCDGVKAFVSVELALN